MQHYSRPAPLEDLKILVSSLNKNHVDYLLIGSYALFAHGHLVTQATQNGSVRKAQN